MPGRERSAKWIHQVAYMRKLPPLMGLGWAERRKFCNLAFDNLPPEQRAFFEQLRDEEKERIKAGKEIVNHPIELPDICVVRINTLEEGLIFKILFL